MQDLRKITPLPSPTVYPSATLTKPVDYPGVFLLELHARPDNRLTQAFLEASIIAPLLDVEREFRASQLGLLESPTESSQGWNTPLAPGQYALVTCGPQDKNRFYSNGLDLTEALASDDFFQHVLYRMYAKFLKFPLPTVASVNGHAFAGGFCLAMAHDYRIMKDNLEKGKAMMAMNEVEFGVAVPLGLGAVFEAKFPTRSALRKCFTEAYRFGVRESLEIGIIDATAPESQLIDTALKFAFEKSIRAASGVYGIIKERLYRDAIEVLQFDESYADPKSIHANRLKQLGAVHHGKAKL